MIDIERRYKHLNIDDLLDLSKDCDNEIQRFREQKAEIHAEIQLKLHERGDMG